MSLARLRVSPRSIASRLSLAALAATVVSSTTLAKNRGDDDSSHSKVHRASPPPAPPQSSAAPTHVATPPPAASTAPMPSSAPTHSAAPAAVVPASAQTTGTVTVTPMHTATPVAPAPAPTTTYVVEEQRPVVVTTGPSLESRGQIPHIDLGVTGGFNNPGGIIGAEAEYRLIEQIGVGAAAGVGAWGTRVTPEVRVYPFGASNFGLFLEGGLSLNFGGASSVTVNGNTQNFNLGLIPAANVSLGLRRQWLTFFYTTAHIGWQWNLRPNAYATTDGSTPDPFAQGVFALSQPGGLIFGVSAGVAFL